MSLKVRYDEEGDVLYLTREGKVVESEMVVWEIDPGVNLVFGPGEQFLAVEILGASRLLREVVESLSERAARS